MKNWQKQIDDLMIPYPEKRWLAAEIADHVENLPASETDAFADSALEELASIHNTKALRLIRKLSPATRTFIELAFIGGPLMGLLTYFTKEKFMVQFFINGGASMYAILAIGLLLLGRETLLFTRVLVLKEHTKTNLKMDSHSVLIGSLALIVFGIGATGLGLYVSIFGALANNMPTNIIIAGFGESIANIIASTTFASLVLLLHYTTRRLLIHWTAPIEM